MSSGLPKQAGAWPAQDSTNWQLLAPDSLTSVFAWLLRRCLILEKKANVGCTRHDTGTAVQTCLAESIGRIPSPDTSSTATSAVSLLSAAGVVGAFVVVTAAVVTGAAVVVGTAVVATGAGVAGGAVAFTVGLGVGATGLGVALTGVAVVATAGRCKRFLVSDQAKNKVCTSMHMLASAGATGKQHSMCLVLVMSDICKSCMDRRASTGMHAPATGADVRGLFSNARPGPAGEPTLHLH